MKIFKTLTAVIAVLVGSAAFAIPPPPVIGADGTIIRRRDLFGGSSIVPTVLQTTSAAMNYFVETTGNDSNSCSSTAATCVAPACLPCLTLQGTVDKIPKILRNSTMVKIGAGSFSGVNISGFSTVTPPGPPGPPVGTDFGGWLALQGKLVNFVPATGTATGTATGVTEANENISIPAGSYGTLSDAAQAWTVDNLRGRLIEITSGPSAGLKRMIASNTATTITITGGWQAATIQFIQPAPAPGDTYAIRDWATTITDIFPNTGVQFLRSYEDMGDLGFGFGIGENLISVVMPGFSSYAVMNVVLDQLKYTGAPNRAIMSNGTGSCNVIRSRFEVDATNLFPTEIWFQSWGTNFVFENSASLPAGAVWVEEDTRAPNTLMALVNNVVDNGATAFAGMRGFSGTFFNSLRGQTTSAFDLQIPTDGVVELNDIDCQLGGGNGIAVKTGDWAFGKVSLEGNNINNCTEAVLLQGGIEVYTTASGGFFPASPNTGGTNTVGYDVSNRASLELRSTDTLTGTTPIFLDGTVYTQAQLQSLTPKSIVSGASGARVFEGAVSPAANFLGDLFQLQKKPTIGTCDALRQGSMATQFGGALEGDTKLCVCKSDGAAVPAFQWCSITITGASNVVCAGGSNVVCP